MFDAEVYIERRRLLAQQINSGLILFIGNNESPRNYPDNPYPFRQDSSFLYYFGLDCPGLVGVIDVDEDKACVFGDDLTVDDIVWTNIDVEDRPVYADFSKGPRPAEQAFKLEID